MNRPNRILCLFLPFALIFSCKQPTDNGEELLPYQDPNRLVAERVEDLLQRMTLEEKIGQMTQVDRGFIQQPQDISDYYLGSILSGGGSTPAVNAPQAWAKMVNTYQSIALQTRLGIPIIYGIDAVHGHNNVVGAVIFPHNIGMGCTRNPSLVEQAAAITAREVAATGIHWTFSPCIAVPRDERWGRTYEGFGEDPELVASMAFAAVRGYQGTDLSAPGTILACAKHFVGDGGTVGGHNAGDVQLDEQALRNIHMLGYLEAIRAGVGSVMASYNSWNGQKVHGDHYLLTTVLKEELGFDGFLVSDWGAIDHLPGDYTSDVRISINAGLDMIMVPQNYREFIGTLKLLVEQEEVALERIDDAVRRILRIKFRLGLFETPYADIGMSSIVGSEEHRDVARECVRQSLVLLKNEAQLLPLSKNLGRIHVAGKAADNLGYQCGGWTITWQGGSGDITEGTTVLEGIRNTVSNSTTVTYSIDGSGAHGADVGIVVVGETPYAEGHGDRTDLSLADEDVSAIMRVKANGIPVVVILISGRPLIISGGLGNWDACLVAWLPGTEGQGVADVLFGDYSPTGKLSFTWPANMDQIPINEGDTGYYPLFEYGYGLSYE
ncbi:MAG: glycoside hydrolase family 3 protein [Candidatus Neomarinimicrobiota bacterium]